MTTPRRQWTDETIREVLLPIASELGRMPTRGELTAHGVGGLWSALGRRGGVDAWREVVANHLTPAPSVEPLAVDEEHVRIAAYFMFQNGHPGGPDSHWLAAEREFATA
jgi:hypothetical protein